MTLIWRNAAVVRRLYLWNTGRKIRYMYNEWTWKMFEVINCLQIDNCIYMYLKEWLRGRPLWNFCLPLVIAVVNILQGLQGRLIFDNIHALALLWRTQERVSFDILVHPCLCINKHAIYYKDETRDVVHMILVFRKSFVLKTYISSIWICLP